MRLERCCSSFFGDTWSNWFSVPTRVRANCNRAPVYLDFQGTPALRSDRVVARTFFRGELVDNVYTGSTNT